MRTLLLLTTLLTAMNALAQQGGLSGNSLLKEYEGLYEYLDNSTLKLIVSPRDQVLYAVIKESKYPLKASTKDVFLNASGDSVFFIRDNTFTIRGYRVNDREFRYLGKVPDEKIYWYAREPKTNKRYAFKQTLKPKLNDGIAIGSINASGLNKKGIDEMVEKVINGTYPDVHSILLLKDGKLVLEEYFYEYNRNSLHQLRSATKSVISALLGIALGKGLIKSIDEPVLGFFPEYPVNNLTTTKQNITIRHLLSNQAGWDCDITIDSSAGNETAMGLSNDWVKFTLDLPMIDTPGTRGRYCSGNAIILGKIIEKVSGMGLSDFARDNLFKPLGIVQYKWSFKPDRSSEETFCQLYMRPRDMLKFGMLYLNNGEWREKQLIPPGWIRESIATHSTVNGTEYGYLWWKQWLNVGGKRNDGVTAKGNGGQRIYLFPEYNLIAVITGGSYNVDSPSDRMLINHVLPGLKVNNR